MIFLEILGKEGSCCVSRRLVSRCFEAVVNPLGRASVSSVIAEAVMELSLSHSSKCTLTFKVLSVKVNPYPLIL